MADQSSKNTANPSEEIDLGQLFKLIGHAFSRLFRGFLRVFLYVKKRIIVLAVLGIVGLLAGYGLSQILTKKHEIEVIVKPNLESKNYLYDVIDEIQANIDANDTAFFSQLGLQLNNLKGYEIAIEPVSDKNVEQEGEIEFLELLQKFENTGMIADVLRAEVLNRTSLIHRISIWYKDSEKGPEFARKVVDYINSNEFFRQLVNVNTSNATEHITENEKLMEQIDLIIANYSERMAQQQLQTGDGRILLDTEERVNITGLFDLKNSLIRDTERKKLELLEQREPITIINFGRPHQVNKAFFTKKIVLVPTLLIILFLLIDLVRYLNRKAGELAKAK